MRTTLPVVIAAFGCLLAACGSSTGGPPDASLGGAGSPDTIAWADTNATVTGPYYWSLSGACSATFPVTDSPALFEGTAAWSLTADGAGTGSPIEIRVFVTFSNAPVAGTEYALGQVASASLSVTDRRTTPLSTWRAEASPLRGSMLLTFSKPDLMPAYAHGAIEATLEAGALNPVGQKGDVTLSARF